MTTNCDKNSQLSIPNGLPVGLLGRHLLRDHGSPPRRYHLPQVLQEHPPCQSKQTAKNNLENVILCTFILSITSSIIFLIFLMVEYTMCALSVDTASGVRQIPLGATPAAMAISVAVSLLPPKHKASCLILYSTLSGPILTHSYK